MTISDEYKAFILELFEPVGPIKVRRMFGGAGIFAPLEQGDIMFGLIANEVIYLKADETNAPDFEAEGKGPFIYDGKTKPVSMSYYELPEYLYDDSDALVIWARKALDAAIKAHAKKTSKKKRKA